MVVEQVMKHAVVPTLVLLASALFQLPTALSAKVSHQQEVNDLQVWLEPMARLEDKRNAGTQNDLLFHVARFYQEVGFQPVWMGPDGLRDQGEVLLRAMDNVLAAGLFFDGNLIGNDQTIRAGGTFFANRTPLIKLAPHVRLDVMLSAEVLRLGQQVSQGQIMPETLYHEWLAPRRSSARDIPIELAKALAADQLMAYIESLHPQGLAYQGLRKAIRQYEQIRQSGGWHPIAPGPALRKGDKGPRVTRLKNRLMLTQDLPSTTNMDGSSYDAVVEAAVKRFQRRHGLSIDGLVGERTRAKLNTPVEARITQLRLNLERWRWYPDNFGNRHVMVNIPAFALHLVDGQHSVAQMRAIVGKKHRQTPVMSGRITYLEFNPYWNIPRKIARTDILPKAIRDPAYLTRQGIRILDSWDHQARELDPSKITWEELSSRPFPYRLRQDPSDVNALGRIKFVFPNPQSVYIHDTPNKSLFDQRKRHSSSGCVRVEAPQALAEYLLRDQGWDPARLEAAIARGDRQTVVLGSPIPVHLVYFTAWVDAVGRVHFREDIYGRDQRLHIALATRDSELVLCGNAIGKRPHLAVGALATTHPTAATDPLGCIGMPRIQPTGKMPGCLMANT